MHQISKNEPLLEKKKQEMDFLHRFHQLGYDLIDLETVESFEWARLSRDDLHLMEQRHHWTNNGIIHSLRSDWTNSIVRYRKQYELHTDKIAYSGPIYTKQSERHQMGVETFTDSVPSQLAVLKDVLHFMSQSLAVPLSVAVVSHNKLLRKLLTNKELENPMVQKFIAERNKDALQHLLNDDHPIIGLMEQPPNLQTDYLRNHFPELEKQLDEITLWEEELKSLNVDFVYVDTLALPSHSYYKGIFIQLYQKNQTEPVASGGQYTSSSKAFGMAINI